MNQNQLRDDTEPRSVDQQHACSARHGERVAWRRMKSCGMLIGYVEWSFDAVYGWRQRTITWQARPKTTIQPTGQELRRVEKLLVKNRNRGGVFERETSWPHSPTIAKKKTTHNEKP